MVSTKSKWIISLTTLGTVFVNFLAVSLPIGGNTTAEISEQFQIYFIPAGYVFSIWSVIYLLLFLFTYTALTTKNADFIRIVEKITPYYLITGILNSTWIISWHTEQFLLSVFVILALLVVLYNIYFVLSKERQNLEKGLELKLLSPFRVYTAWVTVACISNISSYFYFVGWNPPLFSRLVWASVLIFITSVLSVILGVKYKDRAFSLVVLWAIVGIAVKFPSEKSITYSVIIASIVIVIGLIASLTLHRKKSEEVNSLHYQ